ncbi:CAMKV protein, partial [Podilymbus podiceps]|nr:CAMKV protein [Podilymbus podiceps]
MPFGCVTLGPPQDYNQPSEVTDRYDLGQVIKTEEFCEIFRAKAPPTGKLYTCKKFLKRPPRKVRKAAKNEIIIPPLVKHPNILQLVDVYITRNPPFIFLELAAAPPATGREVFDWILDHPPYSERDTSNVIRQVPPPVAYLHSLKIVHRTPPVGGGGWEHPWVLVCPPPWCSQPLCWQLEPPLYYNRLKNSKIVITPPHLAKLENGLIKEPPPTPEYLAPEVVGRQRYGRPVDCWAIGVIMSPPARAEPLSPSPPPPGNPPFYEEADEEAPPNHDKNLFRKILAGDYEFDPPYWDDISQAPPLTKELVTRLMEVEQDQRIPPEEAISHEWISGNAASDKNIKDGVCAQIEKNFARAKPPLGTLCLTVRVTTLMKPPPAPEQTETTPAPATPPATTAAATAATTATPPPAAPAAPGTLPAAAPPPAPSTPPAATCNGPPAATAAAAAATTESPP